MEKIIGKGVPFERIRRITGYLVGTKELTHTIAALLRAGVR